MELNPKHRKFIDEYLIDLNATRAYKAVYKVKDDNAAAVGGNRLLRNPKIKEYVEEQFDKLHNEKTADMQEIIEYLTSVMRGISESEVVVVEGKGEGRSKAVKVKKAPDEKEKLKAAELLGKRFGLFKDKFEIDENVSVVIKGGDDLEE